MEQSIRHTVAVRHLEDLHLDAPLDIDIAARWEEGLEDEELLDNWADFEALGDLYIALEDYIGATGYTKSGHNRCGV
jgi:hypothetical protein